MNTYTLFWLTGEKEIVKGKTPAEAITLAGYSQGAIRALDFYGNGDIRDEYDWDTEARSWIKIK
jgi:hypothetical protein